MSGIGLPWCHMQLCKVIQEARVGISFDFTFFFFGLKKKKKKKKKKKVFAHGTVGLFLGPWGRQTVRISTATVSVK